MKRLFLFTFLMLTAAATAADRVALVIGNTVYDPAKPKGIAPNLVTAGADAKAVAALLQDTLGFKVVLRQDAGLNEMAEAVEEFKTEAAAAKVVLVYFAGHGIESAALGDNFLLPVQAKLAKEAHLKTEAYALKSLISDVQKTPAVTRLVILDCCRNNPLEGRAWYAERGAGGLGAVDTTGLDQTTMVVFSAAPGKPAKDRLQPSDTHSPFAEVLLAKLAEGGKSCATVFGEVEEAVFQKTGEQQRPKTFLNGNLAPFTTFVFRPGAASQPDAAMAAKLAAMEKKLADLEKSGSASKAEAEALKAQLTAMQSVSGGGATQRPGAASLASATKEKPFENTLGMKFVPVAVDGTVVFFCQHETRSRDYAAFMADRQRGYEMTGDDADDWRTYAYIGVPVGRGAGEKAEASDHPVANVSWLDAEAFCEWLSRKEGKTYRLPTDREWSVAVGIPQEGRGAPEALGERGIAGVYPCGEKFEASAISGNYADSAAHAKGTDFGSFIPGYTDGFATTAPVMSFAANGNGLYDIGGNLWEWCAGCYDGTDPSGWNKILTNSRVVRGGSWINDGSAHLLSSFRGFDHPSVRNDRYGFRCVVVGGAGG